MLLQAHKPLRTAKAFSERFRLKRNSGKAREPSFSKRTIERFGGNFTPYKLSFIG